LQAEDLIPCALPALACPLLAHSRPYDGNRVLPRLKSRCGVPDFWRSTKGADLLAY
jgi:hypothetical protein